MIPSSRRALVAALALAAAATATATAQMDPPPQQTRAFGETVEVRVVNVDVVVLDADGNRVKGLSRADFEIFEDGRPMELTHFAAYDEGTPAETLEGERAVLSGGAPSPEPAAAQAPPPATWVVYVDASRLAPGHRNLVLREAQQFLAASLAPGDRAMAAAFDGLSLKILSPLSTDPAPVLAALAKHEKTASAAATQTHARASRIQNAITMINPRERGADQEIAGVRWELDSMLEEETLCMQAALDAFRDLLAILAGIEGRVGLVFGAAGFEANPIENLFRMFEAKFGGRQSLTAPTTGIQEMASRDLDVRVNRVRNEYMRILTSINASRVTVYSVLAGQGRFPDVPSAEIGGAPETAGPSLTTGPTLEGASSVTAFATETGGRSFVAATDLSESLQSARRDFSTYYSLGYRPDREDFGKLHDVKVSVKRAGLRVLHRRGVGDRTPQEEAGNAALTALLGEGAAPNELGIAVEVGAPTEGKRRGKLVPVAIRVPLQRATLMPNGASHRAHFEFHFSIRDPDGGFRRLEPRELAFDVPAEKVAAAMGDFITYRFQVALLPGHYDLGVAALDRIGGTRGTATAAIDVSKGR